MLELFTAPQFGMLHCVCKFSLKISDFQSSYFVEGSVNPFNQAAGYNHLGNIFFTAFRDFNLINVG